jgi:hypothetical protein
MIARGRFDPNINQNLPNCAWDSLARAGTIAFMLGEGGVKHHLLYMLWFRGPNLKICRKLLFSVKSERTPPPPPLHAAPPLATALLRPFVFSVFLLFVSHGLWILIIVNTYASNVKIRSSDDNHPNCQTAINESQNWGKYLLIIMKSNLQLMSNYFQINNYPSNGK